MIGFKKFIRENMVKSERVGIQHLEKMKPIQILQFIKKLNEMKFKFDKTNVKINEKVDGAGIRFGLSSEGRFFLETSHSGPIYDGKEFSQYYIDNNLNPTRGKAYEKIFEMISKDKRIISELHKINQNGIKVVGELICVDLAKWYDEYHIEAVLTRYDRSKLGKYATIVMFELLDGEGEEIENDDLLSKIESSSSDDLKFSTNRMQTPEIELSLNPNVKDLITKDFDDVAKLLGSRKKEDKSAKEDMESILKVLILEIKSQLYDKVMKGKFGDEMEGVVINIDGLPPIKITSDRFKEKKAEYDSSMKRK